MTPKQAEQESRQVKTPAYVFDLDVLKGRVAYLRDKLPQSLALCYAMKANPFLVKELEGAVDRFEVCSPGEYRICEELNLPADKLVISGVHKSEADTEYMVKTHPEMLYTVESEEQFALLSRCAEQNHVTLRVLLRLTSGNQFGMDKSTLKALIQNRNQHSALEIIGIQYYSGTQKHSLRSIGRELDRLNAFLEELELDCGYQAQELEYGAGLPVAYFQEETMDEEELLEGVSQLLAPLTEQFHVTLELGRSIAASCGSFLTQIVDVKRNRGQNYLIVDGGIHHLSYYGQSMAMKHPHFHAVPDRPEEKEPWNVCGSLCTVNDILVKQLPLSCPQKGDVLVFENAGAYSMTEGLSLFLSRDLPTVYLLRGQEEYEEVRSHLPTYPINKPIYHHEGV